MNCEKCDEPITKKDRDMFGSKKYCPICEEENISDGFLKLDKNGEIIND